MSTEEKETKKYAEVRSAYVTNGLLMNIQLDTEVHTLAYTEDGVGVEEQTRTAIDFLYDVTEIMGFYWPHHNIQIYASPHRKAPEESHVKSWARDIMSCNITDEQAEKIVKILYGEENEI